MFYAREKDLSDLNEILGRPGAQFMVVSGRRRVGKTTLLLEWARRSVHLGSLCLLAIRACRNIMTLGVRLCASTLFA